MQPKLAEYVRGARLQFRYTAVWVGKLLANLLALRGAAAIAQSAATHRLGATELSREVSSPQSAADDCARACAALPSGLSDRRLYALRDAGLIDQLGRGLFRRVDAAEDADPDLLEIAYRVP